MNTLKLKLARRSAYSVALIGAFCVAGCEDSNDPDPAVGNYVATSFVTTQNGTPFNHIANGSTINLTLASGGSTSGVVHFEAFGGEPDFDANLNGSWSRNGAIVDLNHSADTFLREMPLTFNGATLTGDATFDGVRIQLTLTRVGIPE
jgi:hypothetical protein